VSEAAFLVLLVLLALLLLPKDSVSLFFSVLSSLSATAVAAAASLLDDFPNEKPRNLG
jgi:hypothetical protein